MWAAVGPRCVPPGPVLATARLRLRPVRADDLDLYRSTFGDAEAMRHVRGRAETDEELRARVRRYSESWRVGGTLHVFAVEPVAELASPRGGVLRAGEAVGDVMVVPVANRGPEIELGYRLAPRSWGLGIATEAAGAVLPYAFGGKASGRLDLEELIAVTNVDNAASQRVLVKLGFEDRGETGRYYEQTTRLFSLSRARFAGLGGAAESGRPGGRGVGGGDGL